MSQPSANQVVHLFGGPYVSPSSTEALDLLPGCYDDWALIERERLRQRILRALEALSRHLVAVHRLGDAVDVAMIAMHAEPLRESAQRALVEAHLAEGNVVEARRAYRSYALLLRREVGVSPSAELRALVESYDECWPESPAWRTPPSRICGSSRDRSDFSYVRSTQRSGDAAVRRSAHGR